VVDLLAQRRFFEVRQRGALHALVLHGHTVNREVVANLALLLAPAQNPLHFLLVVRFEVVGLERHDPIMEEADALMQRHERALGARQHRDEERPGWLRALLVLLDAEHDGVGGVQLNDAAHHFSFAS